ncbi:CPBP family intramembrane glutamic endopeptidase [Edaphobacter bradus]|uniref:CPBP family intramembrane glutamic endopeptidase n=1 Tax=Edaphobacter bradus TaxID=2259016 RepID=UPI0021DF4FD3|nr:CPBP family intramembrane glutamic endopeptidase [Edaphobacter bradus]
MSAFDSTRTDRTSRMLPIALAGTAMAWYLSALLLAGRSARGLTNRFNVDSARPLFGALFLLFLLAIGFSLLANISRRPVSLRELLGLPRRATASREWLLGAAIGWGAAVLAVLPLAVTGALSTGFWTEPRAFGLIFVNLATVAAATLAEEVVFRGYPFRCLIQAIGPTSATVVMAALYSLVHVIGGGGSTGAFLFTFLAGVLLAVGWLRTHGLWLPWGLHFAWNASLGILFGLPVAGSVDTSTVIQSSAFGRTWFAGGDFGPEAGFFSLVALAAAIVVLVRVTRDFAWHYTHAPIVAGGYPMDVAPPPAHSAMEQQSQAASLVQILPSTPQGRSAGDEPKG